MAGGDSFGKNELEKLGKRGEVNSHCNSKKIRLSVIEIFK